MLQLLEKKKMYRNTLNVTYNYMLVKRKYYRLERDRDRDRDRDRQRQRQEEEEGRKQNISHTPDHSLFCVLSR